MPSGVKRLFVQDVRPGMVIAKDIVSDRGVVMLNAYTVLTEQTIERIKGWGFNTLEITADSYEEDNPDIGQEPDKRNFAWQYTNLVEKVKDSFQSVRYCKRIPIDQLRGLSDQVSDALINAKGVINYLHILQMVDDYTFQHSVNVAILSGLFGRWLGLGDDELKNLVFAGLLHDIGKTQIPLSILNKPGKLTHEEMDIMKRHSALGYEILLKASPSLQNIAQAVWAHHERLDGSGYPCGLSGNQIPRNAKIIAIADIYDAMTSDRVYRRSVTPFAVIDTLLSDMFDKLDPTMCTVILNYLQDFFIGNIVRLNDGRQAEVIYVDKARDSRPVVRTREGEYINLERNRSLTIVEILN